MEATGEQKDAPLLRQLVDEGLAIRRRKLVHQGASEQAPPIPNAVETLETIQSLLLKMLGACLHCIPACDEAKSVGFNGSI